ncbi:hypothetical protein DFJ67_6968 [Asanoa ferruginea]|uniref:Uncharacterized protein n=1 Tax=Asanoa ferruginea TaxID=53367 RepID=A0A3D9ZUQ2_9ACTN|nr:hypothetical protein [Asanoa ferruginea]REG00908.1 hypothetical protein DFJ67_6968 [Asanoa ferruginea]GIF47491.1 hypothetical protein Afe04nite_20300 [Asanoa ferruginea]
MSFQSRTSRADHEITDLTDTRHNMPSIVAIAWPTGRPIHSYTLDEITEGVDLYTRALKARTAETARRGDSDAPKR